LEIYRELISFGEVLKSMIFRGGDASPARRGAKDS
jgi:hypothetical protein